MVKVVSLILPVKSFKVHGISATTFLPCWNFALLPSAMILYSPGASFVVPTLVVVVRLRLVEVVSPESFLAETETLIAASAMIARKNGSKRRDISKFAPFRFWNWAAGAYRRNLKGLRSYCYKGRTNPRRAPYQLRCNALLRGYRFLLESVFVVGECDLERFRAL